MVQSVCRKVSAKMLRDVFVMVTLVCFLRLFEVRVQATPLISTGPNDAMEILRPGSMNGVNVFLDCLVYNLNAAYKVSWKKNGIVISDDLNMRQNLNYLVDNARYNIIQNFVGKQYALEISQITETTYQKDNGEYQCIVSDVNNNQRVTQSRKATVAVYDTVACLVNDTFYSNSQLVSAGSITKVTCRTYSLSNPQVSIQLFKQGNDQSSSLSLQQNGQFLNANYVLVLGKDENGMTMTCVSNHPTFPLTKSCTMGPFTVQYKPDVTITPTSYTITSTLDSPWFTCNADANPSVDGYVWKYDGVSIRQSDQFRYGNGHRYLLIRNMSPEDNGMHPLTCEANNAMGTGFGNILITIDILEHISTTTATAIGKITPKATTSVPTQQLSTQRLTDTSVTTLFKLSFMSTETIKDVPFESTGRTLKTSLDEHTADGNNSNITTMVIGVGIGVIVLLIAVILVSVCFSKIRTKSKRQQTSGTRHSENDQSDLPSTPNYHQDDLGNDNIGMDRSTISMEIPAREQTRPNPIGSENESLTHSGSADQSADNYVDAGDNAKSNEIKSARQVEGVHNVFSPDEMQELKQTVCTLKRNQNGGEQPEIEILNANDCASSGPGITESDVGRHDNTAGQEFTNQTVNKPLIRNVEDLTYADLDLSQTLTTKTTSIKKIDDADEETVYAELRM